MEGEDVTVAAEGAPPQQEAAAKELPPAAEGEAAAGQEGPEEPAGEAQEAGEQSREAAEAEAEAGAEEQEEEAGPAAAAAAEEEEAGQAEEEAPPAEEDEEAAEAAPQPVEEQQQQEEEEQEEAPRRHEDEDDDYWAEDGGLDGGEVAAMPEEDADDADSHSDASSVGDQIRQSLLNLNRAMGGDGDDEAAGESLEESMARQEPHGREDEDEEALSDAPSAGPVARHDLDMDEYGDAGEYARAQSLLDMIEDAEEERRMLRDVNDELKRRVRELWERDPHSRPNLVEEKVASNDAVSRDQIRIQHAKILDQANKLIESIGQRQEVVDRRVDRLNTRLDSMDEQATELCESLKAFKRAIARGAEYSRTGKPIKFKRILAMEAAEEEKDKEVETARLKNIHYLNQLAKLEQDLKQKEELADGLHLIDFEQLKIENQTLNEKIEERNDELHKLEKKTTTTVQVLTHVREKLKFVRGENGSLTERVSGLDEQVIAMRDRLTRAKHERDALRHENGVLKQKQGFIGSDLLVADFQRTKNDAEELQAQIAVLRERHARLQRAAGSPRSPRSPRSPGGSRFQ